MGHRKCSSYEEGSQLAYSGEYRRPYLWQTQEDQGGAGQTYFTATSLFTSNRPYKLLIIKQNNLKMLCFAEECVLWYTICPGIK